MINFKNCASALQNRFKNFKRDTLILIVTVLYIPLLPLLILAFTPIYIFRFILSKCTVYFRPDLNKLLDSRSAVLAVDGFPTNPCWNVVVWLTLEGSLDLDKFRTHFLKEYVQKKEGHANKDLKYPEYQQYLVKWLGFYFWKWDNEFKIGNHIRVYDGKYADDKSIIDEDTLVQVIKELSWKPWNPERSPWEFLQIKNYGDASKSILIYRIHHVLGDGNYLLKLLMGDLCNVNLKTIPKPNYMERNIFQKLVFLTGFWIRAPYHLCKMYIEAYDDNPWHKFRQEQFIRPMNAALSSPISLELIKEIKNLQGVSFSSVLYAAVAGGMRNMMIQEGIEGPEDLHMGVPVPMPGHPDKLRNHFICSFITLPVGSENPLERLQRTETIFQEWKASSAAMLNFIKVPLVGSLLPGIMGPFTTNRLSTCLLSNFPGTPTLPTFQGVKVAEMMFGAGFGPGNNGIGFTLCSCNGNIRLLSAVDGNILKTDACVEKLNKKIIQELDVLRKTKIRQ